MSYAQTVDAVVLPEVVLYLDESPDQNTVERAWFDFVRERIADRFGSELILGWCVEDTLYCWGRVRGRSLDELRTLTCIVQRLRAEWAVWPKELQS